MTLEKAIEALKQYQKWRKGKEVKPHPAILSAAIDEAIAVLVDAQKSQDDGK